MNVKISKRDQKHCCKHEKAFTLTIHDRHDRQNALCSHSSNRQGSFRQCSCWSFGHRSSLSERRTKTSKKSKCCSDKKSRCFFASCRGRDTRICCTEKIVEFSQSPRGLKVYHTTTSNVTFFVYRKCLTTQQCDINAKPVTATLMTTGEVRSTANDDNGNALSKTCRSLPTTQHDSDGLVQCSYIISALNRINASNHHGRERFQRRQNAHLRLAAVEYRFHVKKNAATRFTHTKSILIDCCLPPCHYLRPENLHRDPTC